MSCHLYQKIPTYMACKPTNLCNGPMTLKYIKYMYKWLLLHSGYHAQCYLVHIDCQIRCSSGSYFGTQCISNWQRQLVVYGLPISYHGDYKQLYQYIEIYVYQFTICEAREMQRSTNEYLSSQTCHSVKVVQVLLRPPSCDSSYKISISTTQQSIKQNKEQLIIKGIQR